MIDDLLADDAIRSVARRLRGERSESVEEALARAAWTILAEPGDAVAGVLIQEFGAIGGLRYAFDSRAPATPELRSQGAVRTLDEARRRWRPRASSAAVGRALRAALSAQAKLVIPGDDDWPEQLSDLGTQAPVALWVRGRSELLVARPQIAVVGARAASGYGERVASELSGDLAMTGATIVSGGAYGIDGAAHRAALGVGGATIAFLAGGVDRPYPAGHHDLLDRIVAHGAVVSEPPCGAAPTKWRFLARNRLIAALGQATVVVEAGWRSGSLNTAGHAAALGRPLGAVPGPVTSASSAGCHRLLREYGATCVTSAAEVRELVGCVDGPAGEPVALEGDRARLLDSMSARSSRTMNDLAERSGMRTDRVRAILGLLDVEGRVVRDDRGWRRR
ncbi:DNA-processing protein DprA [Microbacterium paraoxydans]|uniref:DNA-processing protein DprA n=1 Tax=Microbacterium paraoxydans TaxID=199592 RepID=A0ABS5IPX5_9MICO|nr:DNA-processing protein DprA [Microbacterium paraoxydans]MBS0025013.1 DNA-processing protein DprA [Microbacterium paraoxydans]